MCAFSTGFHAPDRTDIILCVSPADIDKQAECQIAFCPDRKRGNEDYPINSYTYLISGLDLGAMFFQCDPGYGVIFAVCP